MTVWAFVPRAEPGVTAHVHIIATVSNDGEADVTENFYTSIQFAGQQQFITHNGLKRDTKAYLSADFAASAGNAVVTTDFFGMVSESNEGNNSGYKNGISVTTPAIDQWVAVGPRVFADGVNIGKLGDVAVSGSTVIVSRPRGSGIWKTTDDGVNWRPIGLGLPTMSITAVAVHPSNASLMYAESDLGLFRSTDGGSSWSLFSSQATFGAPSWQEYGQELIIDPNNTSLMYSENGAGQSIKSADAGLTWTMLGQQPVGTTLDDLALDSSDSSVYGAFFGGAGGIYKLDSNSNWVLQTGCAGGAVLPSGAGEFRVATRPGAIYASFATIPATPPGNKTASGYSLFRATSGCGGQMLWTALNAGGLAGSYQTNSTGSFLAVSPVSPFDVYIGGIRLHRSTGGGNFVTIPNVHDDMQGVHITAGGVVYVISDGGIVRSNGGGAFASVGQGIYLSEFWGLSVSPSNQDVLLGGTQDNGTQYRSGVFGPWTQYTANIGDGFATAFDPSDSSIFYHSGQGAPDLRRVDSGGNTPIGCGLPSVVGKNNVQMVPDPTTPLSARRVYLVLSGQPVGGPSLFMKTMPNPVGTCAGLWTTITASPPTEFSRLAIDAATNIRSACSDGGKIFATTPGMPSDFTLAFTLTGGCLDIEVDPDDPSIIYAAVWSDLSGTKPRLVRLRRTATSPAVVLQGDGSSTGDMNSNSISLPAGVQFNTVAVDRNRPTTVYVGTQVRAGGQKSLWRGSLVGSVWNWAPYQDGIHLGEIFELTTHPKTGIMRAVVEASGIFEVYTDTPVGAVGRIDGVLSELRLNDVGDQWGIPGDTLDAEVVFRLQSDPWKGFGFHYRRMSDDPVPSCGHSVYVTGGALPSACSACAQLICSFDSYCCNSAWDGICVNEAKLSCGVRPESKQMFENLLEAQSQYWWPPTLHVDYLRTGLRTGIAKRVWRP
ncbi:MAG: hypothetical protein IT370_27395 [Deltaproteobacteria bacterium]|nr:hypothetical protein [Deltaproteobacteria bacterium]